MQLDAPTRKFNSMSKCTQVDAAKAHLMLINKACC